MTQATIKPAGSRQQLTPEQDEIVRSAIQEITHIATQPEVSLRIIRLVEDPDSTAQDLNNVISNDPALGARILKVVNSSFYGLPGQIGSINRAIVLLGLNALKNVAIAASLAKLFRGGQMCPTFTARDLWSHSIAVASATRMLAAKIGLGLPDEAFLAGLIHDLGLMVEMQAMRPKLVEAVEKVDEDEQLTFREAEIACIGATHEHFGAGLCRVWKFPVSFANAAGHHHQPLEVHEEHRVLPMLVHAADVIAARLEIGYTRTVETDQIDPAIMEGLKLTTQTLQEVEAELPKAAEETAELLRL